MFWVGISVSLLCRFGGGGGRGVCYIVASRLFNSGNLAVHNNSAEVVSSILDKTRILIMVMVSVGESARTSVIRVSKIHPLVDKL